ncbi:MAG: T9SS type A sorting domain-containing protein, partial [Chitinophagaceae bacterium]|nr:T9SS type A sorting domain-containing protein [Chitinophagaceae bacterium]
NNGQTWTKLPSSIDQNPTENGFVDDVFDMIFNIKVDNNGHVYAAVLSAILRSTNGGDTWGGVLFELSGLSTPNTPLASLITDIAISKPGVTPVRYYASFTGRSIDSDTAGVWVSTNGNYAAWTKIGGPGLVPDWKSYNNTISGGNYTAGWGKTVLAVAPNNSNILYVMYQNALSASASQPEADLFRANLSNFPTVTWSTNRSANLSALRNGTTNSYMETQDGYNMLLAVHPTNEDFVIAGGVNLYKSTNAFASPGTFIGGLTSSTYSDPDLSSHVDFHSFSFHPSTPNRFVAGHDGGLQFTNDITASTVQWSSLNNQYQTLQYYHVAIDPTPGSLTFAGGAQDNSTTYRDSKGLLSAFSFLPLPTESNDHYVLVAGDGGSVGLTPSSTSQVMYASVQEGDVYRFFANGASSGYTPSAISPSGSPGSEFITYFHLDPDNTNIMYYAGLNTLWRTSNVASVTATGWTQLTGVSNIIQSGNSIFSLATSRGTYNGNSVLYIGTSNGKIYRLNNPRDVVASTAPVDISPLSFLGMTGQSLVRDIAVNPRNPDTVLAVVSNYGVTSAFWTGNALSASPTWQAVEGNISTASFRSCAIVTTSTGVEYYVGTSIGLFSTTTMNANLTSWQLEGPAVLQGAIVNDLALRTADNTLLIGTHGNGMFYTNIGNVPTSVPDVIVNDKRFINSVFPTVTTSDLYFRTGTITGIKTINIRVTNMSGQVLMQRTQAYQNGSVQLSALSTGSYLVEIISDDRKYKHVQQFVKTR